jgi:hypothetical protein
MHGAWAGKRRKVLTPLNDDASILLLPKFVHGVLKISLQCYLYLFINLIVELLVQGQFFI